MVGTEGFYSEYRVKLGFFNTARQCNGDSIIIRFITKLKKIRGRLDCYMICMQFMASNWWETQSYMAFCYLPKWYFRSNILDVMAITDIGRNSEMKSLSQIYKVMNKCVYIISTVHEIWHGTVHDIENNLPRSIGPLENSYIRRYEKYQSKWTMRILIELPLIISEREYHCKAPISCFIKCLIIKMDRIYFRMRH